MDKKETSTKGQWRKKLDGFLAFLLFIVILPLIPFLILGYFIWRLIWGTWLGFLVKSQWYPQGKYMLFVYSISPNWKEYIETNILPRISAHAMIINWSDRNQWNWKKKPLEFRVFKHWTGVIEYSFKGKKKWDGNEFCPVAITFIPWWRRKIFRFWQPFKDFKHGKEKPLKELEAQLFKILEIVK